jgi:broad specificity phosphatase PhoE
MLYEDIYRNDRERFSEWAADPMRLAPPQGESGMAMVKRVRSWLTDQRGTRALVVTHAGTIRVLRALWAADQSDAPQEAIELDFSRPVAPLTFERLAFVCQTSPG